MLTSSYMPSLSLKEDKAPRKLKEKAKEIVKRVNDGEEVAITAVQLSQLTY